MKKYISREFHYFLYSIFKNRKNKYGMGNLYITKELILISLSMT